MSSPAIEKDKIKLSVGQVWKILLPYARKRVFEQIKSVALIILYLFFFQTVVLRMAVMEASTIALGLAIVVGGLTFFMEGLLLGLMPLGETIGLKLPQKSNVVIISAFAFVLGIGATFAEPAIGILKAAGETVKPWEAPLLFLLLNRYSHYLVGAVGIGVGVAVLFGVLRFLYSWSLKPFIYVLVGALLAISGWAYLDPGMSAISGLAWDCGAVTTGPVTVPLVLALGIGVCRMASKGADESSGFGIVTLASLFPIVAVFALGAALQQSVPGPMAREQFFRPENRASIERLFESKDHLAGYVFKHLDHRDQVALFGGSSEMLGYLKSVSADENRARAIFAPEFKSPQNWAMSKGTGEQQKVLMATGGGVQAEGASGTLDLPDVASRNGTLALQAIIPLVLFLVLVLMLVLRERLPRADEVFLGIFFALIGLTLFNIGIELGLAKLGNQVGRRLPSSFMEVKLPDQKKTIEHFDVGVVQKAVDEKGNEFRFFFFKEGDRIQPYPFDEEVYDPQSKRYVHIPGKGPIFGGESGYLGALLVILFAFVMGYGATLAEPALNALGITVEEITVGTFRKGLLMHSVAVGVGAGIALGVVKIIYGVPLFWLLTPPYLLLLILTWASTEDFVNIGWDSAGVTTGPVTVPLVLAMGLGIGNQIGVVEGFGILAMASVCPILLVLLFGIKVNRAQRVESKEAGTRPGNRISRLWKAARPAESPSSSGEGLPGH
jgi:hypothetical protein